MDIESDESERWEDFFGSSTDLTPSLIGIYDSLTDSFNGNQKIIDGDKYHLQKEINSSDGEDSNFIRSENCTSVSGKNDIVPKNQNNTANKPKVFRVLSPYVQRLIQHTGTEWCSGAPTTVIALCNQLDHQPQTSTKFSNNINYVVNRSFKKTAGKQKLSHIPLSKNTCKLTQARTELVETFNTAIFCSNESLDNTQTPSHKVHSKLLGNDKTPTNADRKFHFDLKTQNNEIPGELNNSSDKLDYIEKYDRLVIHPESEKIYTGSPAPATTSTPSTFKASTSNTSELTPSTPRITEIVKRLQQTTLIRENPFNVECHNTANPKENKNNDEAGDNMNSTTSSTAILSPELLSPVLESETSVFVKHSIGNSDESARVDCGEEITDLYDDSIQHSVLPKKPTLGTTTDSHNARVNRDNDYQHQQGKKSLLSPTSSPLLTYSRVKSDRAQRLSQTLSADSLDRITKMNTEPTTGNSNSRRSASSMLLPETVKLKHRPLSSSSICSTSSSSSSGSEHNIAAKLTISYLASVESLADQSENELLGSNNTLTVFERSCKEIIDSERSYVADLDQVIKGYLKDWRQEACLKEDDLRILFSNIEKIHDFNLILLDQLFNSGMDPVNIAKCFINLREGFDVYTTYCTRYPEAISLLTALLQASHTNALLASTQKMLKHTLPLGSYLLKPVQRILKYHLLLDNLRKHCEVEEVAQAHGIMREVAKNIDQVKRKHEQQSRVKELSGILDGWLGPELTVLGELKQEGLLLENHKPRMVFLFQTMLIITKPKEDSRLQFKSYIYRNNLMLREHLPGEPTSFNVIPYDEPRNQTKLTAKNRDQKRMWAQNIKEVILEQFDIPNRAKELVYKLGDEEDRTPDKNIWKWSLNSSTPIYLERRNQYRRSEIRNRSKIKRKNLTMSVSVEGFSHQDSENQILQRKQSIGDIWMTSLNKSASSKPPTKSSCSHNSNSCKCSFVKNELIVSLSRAQIKQRSKSVPGIAVAKLGESDEEYQSMLKSSESLGATIPKNEKLKTSPDNSKLYRFSSLGRSKSPKIVKPVEVKMYNTKTMPKRIANIKKNKAKKETARFYMNLNDIEDTVLRITESTDNLTVNSLNVPKQPEKSRKTRDSNIPTDSKTESEKSSFPNEKFKNDFEIISELLKENKEFEKIEKILKKPTKKRSFDNGRRISSPELIQSAEEPEIPPPPPSNSPPPLDSEETSGAKQTSNETSEHIYESLLRNVHVPYKFSPVLNRSKSQQYYTRTEARPKQPRPESDYVTLVYSENGELKSVESSSSKKASQIGDVIKTASDSNINYESKTLSECIEEEPTGQKLQFTSVNNLQRQESFSSGKSSSKNLLQRLMHSKIENVSNSENSLLTKGRKSVDGLSLTFGGRNNKPPERRVSDVSDMCRQSIIHRQGSEAVGERMAHLDYADPRTLFACSANNSALSVDRQHDSFFSLTSSNDSVSNEKKKSPANITNRSSFAYEDCVEECLENDLRDSAIYSDDTDRRFENFDDFAENPLMPSSPFKPPLFKKYNHPEISQNPTLLRKMTSPPPEIPIKPKIPLRRLSNGSGIKAPDVFSPRSLEMDDNTQSWVLKQIKNFEK